MPTRSSKPHDGNSAAKHILDQITGDAPKDDCGAVERGLEALAVVGSQLQRQLHRFIERRQQSIQLVLEVEPIDAQLHDRDDLGDYFAQTWIANI